VDPWVGMGRTFCVAFRSRLHDSRYTDGFGTGLIRQQIVLDGNFPETLELRFHVGLEIGRTQISGNRTQFTLKLQPGFVFHCFLNSISPLVDDLIGS